MLYLALALFAKLERSSRMGRWGERIETDGNSVFEAELQDVIPICHATIAGTRIIGRLTAGYVYTHASPSSRNMSWQ